MSRDEGPSMSDRYDVIVIGAGLGGLTAAALIAQAGRKTLLIERNYGVGGAASTYKSGDLVVEASLHETSDPHDPVDPKHHVLAKIGVLELEGQILLSIIAPLVLVKVLFKRTRAILRLRRIRKALPKDP